MYGITELTKDCDISRLFKRQKIITFLRNGNAYYFYITEYAEKCTSLCKLYICTYNCKYSFVINETMIN